MIQQRMAAWRLGFVMAIIAVPGALRSQERAETPWANKLFGKTDPGVVMVHDFGTVPFGSMLVQRFKIQNIYQTPLNIKIHPPSCGCTQASIVNNQAVLQPLDGAELFVTMDARRFNGAKVVTVPVTFTSPDGKFFSTATWRFQAFSRGDVVLTPGYLQFGTVAVGNSQPQSLQIQYTGSDPNWQITEVVANDGPVEATLSQPAKTRGGIAYTLTAALKRTATDGPIQTPIQLRTTDASNPLLTINVNGSIQSPFSINGGNVVKLDAVPVGKVVSKRLPVRGSKAFRIVKVEGEGEGLTVRITPLPSNTVQVIEVEFQASSPGELKRQVRLITETGEAITFPVHAIAVAE